MLAQRISDLKNRMREICTSGSVRGALGNWGPYSTIKRLELLLF